ncbi:TPA: hypothetical protein HA241_00015 [Candidatus Woesearchaeota archaeon]|nr:hypothetical protein [Candidatus Woesearchaeota archaeon]
MIDLTAPILEGWRPATIYLISSQKLEKLVFHPRSNREKQNYNAALREVCGEREVIREFMAVFGKKYGYGKDGQTTEDIFEDKYWRETYRLPDGWKLDDFQRPHHLPRAIEYYISVCWIRRQTPIVVVKREGTTGDFLEQYLTVFTEKEQDVDDASNRLAHTSGWKVMVRGR